MITTLKPHQYIVVGTNANGMHVGGAAAQAHRDFGALCGQSECCIGGQSYGIVTLDSNMQKVSINYIQQQAETLKVVALANPDMEFLLTAVGCGIAGFTVDEIAPLFQGMPENVIVCAEFKQ